jgi:peptide/nickel transport system substrate-binding protein
VGETRRKVNSIGTLMVVMGLLSSVVAGCAPAPAPTEVAPSGTATSASAATAAPSPTPTAVPKGGKLIFGLSWEPAGADPHVTSSPQGRMLARLVFDTLVVSAPDGTMYPSLATDWEMSDDGLTYTFHLRQDVHFHDGNPFNAEAVKYSLDRIVDPATKSEIAASLLGPYESTEVVDDYTVRVHLSEPFGPFMTVLTIPFIAMVSPEAAEKWGEDFDDHLVGTGPFIFKEWVRADHWTLERNPDYNWAPEFYKHQGPAYLDEIVFKFIPEATVRVGTLTTGETQMIVDVPPLDYHVLNADDAYVTYQGIQPGVPCSVAMNVTREPLDDVRVRQAIEYAIDRSSIVDTLFLRLWPVAYAPLSPTSLGYWPGAEQMYGYDPDKAMSLLDEAGWVDTDGDGIRDKDGKPLRLWWPVYTYQRMNEMAEMVQAQLKEVGIDVNVEVTTFPTLWEAATKCQHDLLHFGFPLPETDAALSTVFASSNVGTGWSHTCTKSDEIDQLLAEGRATADTDKRVEIYQKLQKLIMDQALIVPIREWTTLAAWRAEVQDVAWDVDGQVVLLYDTYVSQ